MPVLRVRPVLGVVLSIALVGACTHDQPAPRAAAVVLRSGSAIPARVTPFTGPAKLDCAGTRPTEADPAKLPAEYDASDYKGSSSRDPRLATSIHQLCGQRGDGTDVAWSTTQGDPAVVTAITDSGIRWRDPKAMADLATQIALNPGELPLPEDASGKPYAHHDRNHDGAVDMVDYAEDPRITDRNGNGVRDPEDVILDPSFSDGTDADHNGFVDDIAGWDFLDDDNDPADDVSYGHGTGEARDAAAAANGTGDVGTCPRCHVLPIRVGDSFVADAGRFAAGVFFAIDHHASLVQSALGAINNPSVVQQSIDAARAAGIPVVASMADEESSHPNLPSSLPGTIAVNSVTSTEDSIIPLKPSTLAINGCTNTGSSIWVSVPSDSCSSEAAGRASGIVGLVESEARAADIPPYPGLPKGGNRLSSDEVAQVIRLTADDVDFATPNPTEPANDVESGPGTTRFPTAPGWDATTGYGRIDAAAAVRSLAGRSVPPEAAVVSPTPGELVDPSRKLEVRGRVAAVRSSSYSYRVEWAVGPQPPADPGRDEWHVAATARKQRTGIDGRLASIDLARVAAAMTHGTTGAPADGGVPDPDRFAVRVRIVVTDAEGRVGTDQRTIDVHHDPGLVAVRRVPGAGAGSPVLADIDGDGTTELVVPTDDGMLHAYRSDWSEPAGWPVRSPVAFYWHETSPAVRAARVPAPHAAFVMGHVVVADLDGDHRVEIAATDLEGDLNVWEPDGSRRKGFELLRRGAREASRAAVDPDYSRPEATDSRNRLLGQFWSQPAVADLDGDGKLEIVAAAADRHLYAWHADGSAVAGFPALVADPSTAKSVDPVTNHVTYVDGSVDDGGGPIATPVIADLDGDGRPEIVIGAQEEYSEDLAVVPAPSTFGSGGNTRLFAFEGDGRLRPGWPAKVAMMQRGVLPNIGLGVTMSAAVVTGSPTQVLATSAAGPTHRLVADGRPVDPTAQVLPWMNASPAVAQSALAPGSTIFSAFGGIGVGDVTGDGRPDVVEPVVNDRRAIDQAVPDHQDGAGEFLAVWDLASGRLRSIVPTADLGFFVQPTVAGGVAYAGNGVSTLDAVDGNGEIAGWPKLTGGWVVGIPAVGSFGRRGSIVAVTRRDGWLLAWSTPT